MATISPRTTDDCITAIRIYRSSRIGPRNFWALIEQSESFEHAWEQFLEAYRKNRIDPKEICKREEAESEFEKGIRFGAKFLFRRAGEYPEALDEIETAPPFLWAKGDLNLITREKVALIGARNASIEGVRMARGLARDLSNAHVAVVSGLARGIDAAAHEGALSHGTVGIVAGGLDVFYPKQNKILQENMFERGLVLSEMPFSFQPQARNFPQRNRIIAGLSRITVVVEALIHSGSMITAGDALTFGREVMAVPGHPFQKRSEGVNSLIKNGSGIVQTAQDILEKLNLSQENQGFVEPSNETSNHHHQEEATSTVSLRQKLVRQGLMEIEGERVRQIDEQVG